MLGGMTQVKAHDEQHYGLGSARVLLMRHGETESNLKRVFLGKVDAPLSELGERQSQEAVEALRAWAPDRIVTSPLERCRVKIAEPAARLLGVPCTVDERIAEFDFGPLEGMTYQAASEAGMPMPWGPASAQWPPTEGGESLDEFYQRISAAAAKIEGMPGKTAVICHGGVIRGFFGVWLRMEVESWNQLVVDNVSSTLFRARPGFMALEQFGLSTEQLRNLAT